MKGKKLLSKIIPVLSYLAFGAVLVGMFSTAGKCPYSKCISQVEMDTKPAGGDQYIYQIEEASVDHEDPFELAKIRGWVVQPDGEYYGPVLGKLLLYSEDVSYCVELFREKRIDVIYMDQSDPNSEKLEVGFVAYFPVDEVKAGEYQIGFQVEGGSAFLTSDTFTTQ